jgi:hypothetical protein
VVSCTTSIPVACAKWWSSRPYAACTRNGARHESGLSDRDRSRVRLRGPAGLGDDLRWAYPCAPLREWPPRFPVRSDFPGAVGIPRQLDHVAFDLNRVSPLVIAGLDPAIYAEKALRRPCRDGFDSMRLWLGCGSPPITVMSNRSGARATSSSTVRLALNWWYYMRKSTVLGKARV